MKSLRCQSRFYFGYWDQLVHRNYAFGIFIVGMSLIICLTAKQLLEGDILLDRGSLAQGTM